MKSFKQMVEERPKAQSGIAAGFVILCVGVVLWLNATLFDVTEHKAIIEIAVVVAVREVVGFLRSEG